MSCLFIGWILSKSTIRIEKIDINKNTSISYDDAEMKHYRRDYGDVVCDDTTWCDVSSNFVGFPDQMAAVRHQTPFIYN